MNPEVKAKWLEALRSGKYIRTAGELRSPTNGYCCLGVLCDIYDPSKWKQTRGWYTYSSRDGESSMAYLIQEVRDWSKLSKANQHTLSNINDSPDSIEFDRVIDYIEAKL
jgi:hypothetical protein